jgi:phage recombination protein Bet
MSNTQVVTTNSNSGAVVDYEKSAEIIDVVKKMVFPFAPTEAELVVFLQKCKTAGVHPLDKKIYPVKFSGTMVFITSIDYMRSRAIASGVYDGCDDVEFSGETDGHPDEAIVRVYRKNISRPFVGRATWKEFYPGDARGKMWNDKPRVMLGKCAEAQAYRKAFPDDFGQLYDGAEMDAVLEGATAKEKSGKPKITAADVVVIEEAGPAESVGERKTGIVENVSQKDGTNKNGKTYTRYGVTINGVIYGTFDDKIGDRAQDLTGQPVIFTASDDGKYKNLLTIELDDSGAK